MRITDQLFVDFVCLAIIIFLLKIETLFQIRSPFDRLGHVEAVDDNPPLTSRYGVTEEKAAIKTWRRMCQF